jgi:hypothetical protein
MGGGGDNGYEARQQGIEDKKTQARDALNALFGGYAPASGSLAAPTREQFTTPGTASHWVERGDPNSDNTWSEMVSETKPMFDQAKYDQAQAQYSMLNSSGQNAQSRDALYQQVRDTAFNSGKRSLDEGKQEAARKNKFELFARGLAGGSEDIDQNAKLNRTYQQGIMDLGAKADSAKAGFRNADEDTRLQLLQSIDNGMDTGSALSAASNRMKIAADQASADAQGTSLGNLFDTSGLIYQQSQAAKGRQAGQEWWNQYGNPSKRAGSAPTGVATRLPGE